MCSKNAIETQIASVDWVTITVKDKGRRGLIAAEAMRLMDELKSQGNVQRPWGFCGYDGWSCASVRWGDRETDSILMLSGEAASLNWPIALSWFDNCSRLDLAVTVTLLEPRKHVARDAYELLNPPDSKVTAPRKMTFIENNEGGETFYIGSRLSDQFGRLYDKGIQMGENTDCPAGLIWRYEVEFKAYRAKRVATQLIETVQIEENYHGNLGETVYKWFLSRGVRPIFSTYNTLPFSTEVYAKLSDDDATLNWLSTQVAPSVKRLSKNGKGAEVLEALGLLGD